MKVPKMQPLKHEQIRQLFFVVHSSLLFCSARVFTRYFAEDIQMDPIDLPLASEQPSCRIFLDPTTVLDTTWTCADQETRRVVEECHALQLLSIFAWQGVPYLCVMEQGKRGNEGGKVFPGKISVFLTLCILVFPMLVLKGRVSVRMTGASRAPKVCSQTEERWTFLWNMQGQANAKQKCLRSGQAKRF